MPAGAVEAGFTVAWHGPRPRTGDFVL